MRSHAGSEFEHRLSIPVLSLDPRVCSGLWPNSGSRPSRADSRWRLLETAWVGLGLARNWRA